MWILAGVQVCLVERLQGQLRCAVYKSCYWLGSKELEQVVAESKECMLHDLNVFYIMLLDKCACRVCVLFIFVVF